MSTILHALTQLASTELTDGQLLGRYVTTGDAAAFETLVRRHGPMVRQADAVLLLAAHRPAHGVSFPPELNDRFGGIQAGQAVIVAVGATQDGPRRRRKRCIFSDSHPRLSRLPRPFRKTWPWSPENRASRWARIQNRSLITVGTNGMTRARPVFRAVSVHLADSVDPISSTEGQGRWL